ncbi:MAG: sugar phosphate nucleotidyltransferase [Clostridia bacterium]
MIKALIMCGGIGTRIWPKSVPEKPKQFQKMLDQKTMLQHTYERLSKYLNKDSIYFSTREEFVDLIIEQIDNVNINNIIIEPCSMNTAPSILFATLFIKNQEKGKFNLFVVPSDHMILDEDLFLNSLTIANEEITNDKSKIITFGILPNRAETNYGYIKIQNNILDNEINRLQKAETFIEKPDYKLAKKYIKKGTYFWNSGMYIFNSEIIIEEYKKYDEYNYNIINNICKSKLFNNIDKKRYSLCKNISIDCAIMEKSENIFVLPVNFRWDDIGVWSALKRYIKCDKEKNILHGNIKINNASNNLVYSDDREIIINDIDNIYCINSNGKIIIGKVNNLSKVYLLKEEK